MLATDWSPKMIEHFNARAGAEGLDAEGRVMDCHALDLADDTYDITGSQFGVMLVPDQAQALREMVRVTRPGGRVLLIAYGNPDEFEALHFFISAVQAVVPEFEGPAEDEPMLEFQVADPDVLRQRLIDAGLTDVTVDTSHQERIDGADRTAALGLVPRRQPDPGHARRRSHRRATRRHHPGPRRNRPRTLRRHRPGRADRAVEHRDRYEVEHFNQQAITVKFATLPSVLLSRSGARFRSFDRPVSPGRFPNRPCDFHRNGLSEVEPDRRGARSMPAVVKIFHSVDAATRWPSPSSSPWICR